MLQSFRTKQVNIYQDDNLMRELAALRITEKADGSTLEDPSDRTVRVERGMSFALALMWAQGTLVEMVEEQG